MKRKTVATAVGSAVGATSTQQGMANVGVVAEILKVTGEKQKGKKEAGGTFYARLITAGAKDDDTWGKLSKASQDWITKNADAAAKAETHEKIEAPEAGDTKAAETKPPASTRPGAAAKPAAAPKPEKVPAGPSVAELTRVALCKKPAATKEEVLATVREKIADAKEDRVSQIYDATKAVLLILRDQKKLEFKLPGEAAAAK